MNPFRVIAFPLLGGAIFVEVYALVLQGATDACSFGYCAVGHGGTVAAPHGLAAVAGMFAVLILAGAVVLDRRLGRRMPAKPASVWTRLFTTALIGTLGIAAWFATLSFLTWGQPFSWIAGPGPCNPPALDYCDAQTEAQRFQDYGWSALWFATGAGVLVMTALIGARSLVTRLWRPRAAQHPSTGPAAEPR